MKNFLKFTLILFIFTSLSFEGTCQEIASDKKVKIEKIKKSEQKTPQEFMAIESQKNLLQAESQIETSYPELKVGWQGLEKDSQVETPKNPFIENSEFVRIRYLSGGQ